MDLYFIGYGILVSVIGRNIASFSSLSEGGRKSHAADEISLEHGLAIHTNSRASARGRGFGTPSRIAVETTASHSRHRFVLRR
jgi:hypothetical protein